MNEHKDWSELEITAIVQTHQSSFEDRIMVALARQNVILDKVADGVQTQVLTSTMMVGNPALGVTGFIPEVRQKLADLEVITRVNQTNIAFNQKANTERLEILEKGQHNILRAIKALCTDWTHTTQGDLDFRKVSGLLIATWGAMHFLMTKEFWFEARKLWIEITSMVHL